MWWGYSQALDLVEEFAKSKPEECDNEDSLTCNVLLIGQGDGRHMLKTIAQKYRHNENIAVNFYVYEPCLGNIARELLFTTLALEPPENIGLAEKTLFFLELYGNSLIRPATSKYLKKISKRLLNIITNTEYGLKILPNVSLDNLKYKERDELEWNFKYWIFGDQSFNILRCWDNNLRKYLGVRYDTRLGAYDWDYHMRYRNSGAETLQPQEYKKFREKGISFHFEDTDPCVTNYTLASGTFSSGSKVLSFGYLGDFMTGPYPTFGFSCEDEDMLKKVNGQISKRATDVTERNVMRMFYELEYQKPFLPLNKDEDYCTALMVDTSDKLKVQDEHNDDDQIKIKDSCQVYESLGTNNCKIWFLSTKTLSDLTKKAKYDNFFNLMYICQPLSLKTLKPDLFKIFKNNSKIIVETPKYLINYRKEHLKKFKDDLLNVMEECSCNEIGCYSPEADDIAYFIYKKEDQQQINKS